MTLARHPRVGVLGGGQLGRMMAFAAHRLGMTLVTLDPKGETSPAGLVTQHLVGHFNDADKVKKLADKVLSLASEGERAIITVEIEHVSTDGLVALEKEGKVCVQPPSSTLRTIQDKFVQKEHMRAAGIPIGPFIRIDSIAELRAAGSEWGYPLMLKSRRLAYDGKGNHVVASDEGVEAAYKALGGDKPRAGETEEGGVLYAEKWCPFKKELAIMVVQSVTGEVSCYPCVETEQRDNICHTVTAPANVPPTVAAAAETLARAVMKSFEHSAGVFGVELFLTEDGEVLLNEIAPRPHNSGHYTIEACYTDQFENHLRAIVGLPLGDCSLKVGAACMVNILGDGDKATTMAIADRALSVPGAIVHWYAKEGCAKGRKVGHITVCAPGAEELQQRVKHLLQEETDEKTPAKKRRV